VAYRPVAGQRPGKKQLVQPLLCNRRINKQPFLSNCSVNTFPRKRDAHNNIVTMETWVFSTFSYVVSVEAGVEYLHRNPASCRRRPKGKSRI
jgi:hypothetical protein